MNREAGLVERLRAATHGDKPGEELDADVLGQLADEAASHIEALEAANAVAREALKDDSIEPIAALLNEHGPSPVCEIYNRAVETLDRLRRASQALAGVEAPLSLGGEEDSSVAGLPAHVADATATDAHSHSGKED